MQKGNNQLCIKIPKLKFGVMKENRKKYRRIMCKENRKNKEQIHGIYIF